MWCRYKQHITKKSCCISQGSSLPYDVTSAIYNAVGNGQCQWHHMSKNLSCTLFWLSWPIKFNDAIDDANAGTTWPKMSCFTLFESILTLWTQWCYWWSTQCNMTPVLAPMATLCFHLSSHVVNHLIIIFWTSVISLCIVATYRTLKIFNSNKEWFLRQK